jgi:predicted dehydrogenase
MIRVGLVGAGPWARYFHAPMLAAAPQLHLSGVWARRSDAAQEVGAAFNAPAARTFDELLAGCDAVAFTVPPGVQADLAPQAARAGKHLLLEKPVAATLESAKRLAEVIDDAGVVSQLMLTNRYTTATREFLRAISGATVFAVTGSFVSGATLPGSPFATPWRLGPGAALLDLGPHCFDLLEATAGPVAEVTAQDCGGVITVTTRHRNGAVGHLTMSGTTPGARGPLKMNAVTDIGFETMADPGGDDPDRVQRRVTDEFSAAVRGHPRSPLDVHRGVLIQRLLTAAFESLHSQRPSVLR